MIVFRGLAVLCVAIAMAGCAFNSHTPEKANDSQAHGKILPPETGVYVGQTQLNPGEIAAFEQAIVQPVAIAADLSVMHGQEEPGEEGALWFDVAKAREYWEKGAVVCVGAYETTPGHHPFTVDKLLRGEYDQDLKKLAAQFREFGRPMFFGAAREPNGVLAPYSGGYGPDGDEGVGWAERTGRWRGEFIPPAPPPRNQTLYDGLGDPSLDDAIERLAAAQRYYHDFFVRREGLGILTFETMGWAVPTWESEPREISSFDEFYRLVADYSDWVSINFYMWTEPADDGTPQPEPPIDHYLRCLDRVMEQLSRLAPEKPVLITELGFAEPSRVEKIRRGLTAIIKDYPQIKGFIQWGDFAAIRPGTPAARTFRQVIDANAEYFHHNIYHE
jgi:hypothetical protein